MKADINFVADRLSEIDELIHEAVQSAESDMATSTALRAVLRELTRKSEQAISDLEEAGHEPIREYIVELEQAADDAKAAAVAEEGIDSATLHTIFKAHDAIEELKEETRGE